MTDSSSACATITAASDEVESTRRELLRLFNNEHRRLSDPLQIRQTDGVPAYLRALANQPVSLPTYWTTNRPQPDVKDPGNSKLHRYRSLIHFTPLSPPCVADADIIFLLCGFFFFYLLSFFLT